jgi:phosphohistidine swiveling domain-containing protein
MSSAAAVRPAIAPVLLCPLAEARDAEQTGGKAAGLARLMADGVPVPDGVALTRHAFESFLEPGQLRSRIDALSPGLTDVSSDAARAVADDIRALVMAAPLPLAIEASLQRVARQLFPGFVAVRSSAIGEDGAVASFAGQFDTVLHVHSLPGLRDALRQCYASYWSARAILYRRQRALDDSGMAVVVQRQIEPAAAGVLFTRSPSGGSEADRTLAIEYCPGLADALVSGAIDPGRVLVCRETRAIVSDVPAAGAEAERARVAVLEHVPGLTDIALRLEARFGSALDIEWAIDAAGIVWFVQARPITTSKAASGSPRTNVLWTNANVSENFPDPISPLLYSVASLGYYHYFRNLGIAFGVSRRRLDAMDAPLRGIIGAHGARMYYNLTNIHAVLRMAPFGESLAQAFNTFVGADRIAPPPEDAETWGGNRHRVSQTLELGRITACTAWQYARLGHRVRLFERTADVFAAATRPGQPAMASLPMLGRSIASFLTIRTRHWKNASLADAAAMITYALLERVLSSCGHGRGTVTRLLRALPDVPSSVPPLRLWDLSRLIRDDAALGELFADGDASRIVHALRSDPRFREFRAQFDRFLEQWGFRSSAELMLTLPGLDERPEPVIELLRQYARLDGDSPEASMAERAIERRRETSRVLRSIAVRSPMRAALAWCLVRWTQRSVTYRERVRLKQALLYTRLRRVLLRVGDLLVERGTLRARDDVFMLTVAEVVELIGGRSMCGESVADLVLLRRRQHDQLRALNPPDTFLFPEGEVFGARTAPQREAASAAVEAPAGATLTGSSACGGIVTARAAVLAGVGEASRLMRGDVLVTRQTDPGWAPVFCLVSGLVIERGGMLSHGAIIAREFGVPCVVGVKDASRVIPHGAMVTVDGNRGECRVGAPR